MRKIIKKMAGLLLLLPTFAFGQAAYYQNNAFTATYLNGTHVVTVIDGAQVEVCTTVTGACTQVNVYSDQAMTNRISQPFAVDSGGNFGFFVAPGTYSYWVLDSVGTPLVQLPFTVGGSGGSGSVSSVFGRTGAVLATTGDYTVSQITGAAPLASPTFTGTVTLPITGSTQCLQVNSSGMVSGTACSTAGVSSLNSLTGAVNIVAGANISVTPSGSSITVASTAPAALSGQTAGYLPKANTATTSIGPSIISDDGTNATVHGGVTASNVTDSVLMPGNCVQAAAGGLLGTSGAPCLTANAVTSVFGRTGAIVATTGDYTVSQVTGAASSASPIFTGTVTFNTGVPTLSTCAGGSVAGSNNAFHITGLTGTACTATFSATLAHGVCTANAYEGTTPETVIPDANTTAVTFTVPSGTTDITAICF